MISKFKVPEYKGEASLTPEQLEASKKRLDEVIENWRKFEQEYPELAWEMLAMLYSV